MHIRHRVCTFMTAYGHCNEEEKQGIPTTPISVIIDDGKLLKFRPRPRVVEYEAETRGQYPNFCLNINDFVGAPSGISHARPPCHCTFLICPDAVVQSASSLGHSVAHFHIVRRAPRELSKQSAHIKTIKKMASDDNGMVFSLQFRSLYIVEVHWSVDSSVIYIKDVLHWEIADFHIWNTEVFPFCSADVRVPVWC